MRLMERVQCTVHVTVQQVIDELVDRDRLTGTLGNLDPDPGFLGSFPVHASR